MNKRLMAILCALALPLSGCGVSGGETLPPEGAYKVYYAVTGKQATVRSVDYEYRIPDADAETASALARMVMTAPETYGLSSPGRRSTSAPRSWRRTDASTWTSRSSTADSPALT